MNGTWSSKDATVTITDVSGSYACAEPNQTAVYGWKADGDSVTFTRKKDACDDRAPALDGKTWKRKDLTLSAREPGIAEIRVPCSFQCLA